MSDKVLAGGLALALLAVAPVVARGQEKPAYTPAEYNAYTACANEKVAQQRSRCLTDFVAKFPNSTLLPFVYRLEYLTYYELRDYVNTVEHVDRLLALGDKLEFNSRLEALVARAQAFYLGSGQRALQSPEQLNRARSTSAEGLKAVAEWKKPEGLTDEQYNQQKKGFTILFHSIAGIASLQLKDYRPAAEALQAALALEPNDALNNYRLGIALLQQTPAQSEDGFWAVARAIALKVPNEGQVRNYLRTQMLRYQGTACEKEIDPQMNEVVALATASPRRPENYHVPSQAELTKARESASTFLQTLQAGGGPAKVMWLAMCGLDFPEVAGKVIAVGTGNDSVALKLFLGATPEQTEAGTTPNMEVKVMGQPAAQLLKKDDAVRFAGTLARYTQDPFMVFWENGKIKAEDLPVMKAPPKATKRPTKRTPTKRPPTKRTTP